MFKRACISIDSIYAHTEPLPLVPATCITLNALSGSPSPCRNSRPSSNVCFVVNFGSSYIYFTASSYVYGMITICHYEHNPVITEPCRASSSMLRICPVTWITAQASPSPGQASGCTSQASPSPHRPWPEALWR